MSFIIWHLLAICSVIAVSFCAGVIYGIKHIEKEWVQE
jgi:hypothetical protein